MILLRRASRRCRCCGAKVKRHWTRRPRAGSRTRRRPEVAVRRKERSEILRRSWSKLSPEHRDIIDLISDQEKAIVDVAETIGIPENTVKTRMFYARKRLSELLKGAGLDQA
jgi:RNA polymerase sigma-70 factor (ECF subfamily)